MTKVKIMYWKNIPYGVRAFDDDGRATRQLPDQFTATVDTAAMVDGDTAQNDYRDGFTWSEAEEREGSAAEVADAVVAEIIKTYPVARMAQRQEMET